MVRCDLTCPIEAMIKIEMEAGETEVYDFYSWPHTHPIRGATLS